LGEIGRTREEGKSVEVRVEGRVSGVEGRSDEKLQVTDVRFRVSGFGRGEIADT